MKAFTALLVFQLTLQATLGLSPRIVGGTAAARGQAPWQVLIERTDNVLKPFCAGSLISKEWVLTSGQCAHGQSKLVVISGISSFIAGNDQGEGSNVQTVLRVILHPSFNPSGGGHDDIALLRLKEPLKNSQYIRPIRLPRPNYWGTSFVGSTARIFGWGVTTDADFNVDVLNRPLKFVDMTIITNEQCALSYGSYVNPAHICTSGVGGGSICERDQGGALVVQETDGQWTQVGVASFFDSLSCEAKRPSGFTRVSSYLEWIAANTGIERPAPEVPDFVGQAAVGDIPSSISIWAAVKNASHPEAQDTTIPFCTGALISSSHVAITGSCVDSMRGPAIPLIRLEVGAGHVLTADMVQGRIKVATVTRYGSETNRDTVAVLKLSEEMNSTTSIGIVKRASTSVADGTVCTLSGWNHFLQDDGVSGYLAAGTVTIRPVSSCPPRSGSEYATVCAQHVAGSPQDKCVPAREGALLICDGQLTGLYSSMEDSANSDCTSARHFLEIKQFNSWIDKQVKGAGTSLLITPVFLFITVCISTLL